MEWWQAVIVGLVEGITEYLPVSSTGHLILTNALLGIDGSGPQKEAIDAFSVIIQGGAILAVLGLYRQRVWQMIVGLLGVVKIGQGNKAGLNLAINLIVAFLPAAILGPVLDDAIEARLFHTGPVLAALALGGVFMILIDRWKIRRAHASSHEQALDAETAGKEIESVTVMQALFIGLMQMVAMWPGTSRSMMTIVAGVLTGLKPKAAAEFSFLLGLPTLGGACVYKLGKNLYAAHQSNSQTFFEIIGLVPVAIGLIVATISAAIAVKWLVGFLTRHGLSLFGWYRIILAALLALLIALGVVTIGTSSDKAPSPPQAYQSTALPAQPARLFVNITL